MRENNGTKISIEGQGDFKRVNFKNDDVQIEMTNLGCRILSLCTKDKDGRFENIILGLRNPEEDYQKDSKFLGAVIGRVANRIRDGRFHLNQQEYQLTINEKNNHLHGGKDGFHNRLFNCEEINSGVRFTYISPDGEEGYPGQLIFQNTFILEGNCLRIIYEATCDQDTLFNPTNHTYFNLTGCKESILNHQLQIEADQIAEIDEQGIPTGIFLNVAESPFDFRHARHIGESIHEMHPQLQLGNGYDHPYLLSNQGARIVLSEEKTGRIVEISTDMPSIQLYTGNFLSGGCIGAIDRAYENREGVALETQFLPDSIHLEEKSPTKLKKGIHFRSETQYRFSVM